MKRFSTCLSLVGALAVLFAGMSSGADVTFTLNTTNKTFTTDNTIAIRESVDISVVNIGTSNPTNLIFAILDYTNVMVVGTEFTNAGSNAEGPVNFNTVEMTNYFSGRRVGRSSHEFTCTIWDTVQTNLLANDVLEILNNPYYTGMQNPVSVTNWSDSDLRYLRLDGGNAMAADLDMGGYSVSNVLWLKFGDNQGATNIVQGGVALDSNSWSLASTRYVEEAIQTRSPSLQGQLTHTNYIGVSNLLARTGDARSGSNILYTTITATDTSRWEAAVDTNALQDASITALNTASNQIPINTATGSTHATLLSALVSATNAQQVLIDALEGSTNLIQQTNDVQNTDIDQLQTATNELQVLIDALITATNNLSAADNTIMSTNHTGSIIAQIWPGLQVHSNFTVSGCDVINNTTNLTIAIRDWLSLSNSVISGAAAGQQALAYGDHRTYGYLTASTNEFDMVLLADNATNLQGAELVWNGSFTNAAAPDWALTNCSHVSSGSYSNMIQFAAGDAAGSLTASNMVVINARGLYDVSYVIHSFGDAVTNTVTLGGVSKSYVNAVVTTNNFRHYTENTNNLTISLTPGPTYNVYIDEVSVQAYTNGDVYIAGDLYVKTTNVGVQVSRNVQDITAVSNQLGAATNALSFDYATVVMFPTNDFYETVWLGPRAEAVTLDWVWVKTDVSTCVVQLVEASTNAGWRTYTTTNTPRITGVTQSVYRTDFADAEIGAWNDWGVVVRANDPGCSNCVVRVRLKW